jgi:hypothetical protein
MMAVDWRGPEIVQRINRAAMRGVIIAIGLVEARAVHLITQTTKSGRQYRRRGRIHQSSAPGQPFASDTGTTLNRRTIDLDHSKLKGRLTFRSQNAVRLEHGTRKMAPRPFARRALVEVRRPAEQAVVAEVARELSHK